jgi:hypothetical protein
VEWWWRSIFSKVRQRWIFVFGKTVLGNQLGADYMCLFGIMDTSRFP